MLNDGLVDDHSGMFIIQHRPSGDRAEAATMEAAIVAARTLVNDYGIGTSTIHSEDGRQLDSVSLSQHGSWFHSRSFKSDS